MIDKENKDNKIKSSVMLDKHLGETPLECILRFKDANVQYRDLPMTYAGRLDPMAEGALLCLVGDECKQKDKYLALDKEYEFEILLGFDTDTHDLLGLVLDNNKVFDKKEILDKSNFNKFLINFLGKRKQIYPAYSSKTIKGKQLHELARSGDLSYAELLEREVDIYSLDFIGQRSLQRDELLKEITRRISLVKGDFRQGIIVDKWKNILGKFKNEENFEILKLRMKCSSGTYVRALVRDLGTEIKFPMTTFSILRTGQGKFL